VIFRRCKRGVCKSDCSRHRWYFRRGRGGRPLAIDQYAAPRMVADGYPPHPIRLKTEARFWEARILGDLQVNRDPRVPPPAPPRAPEPQLANRTFGEVLDEFWGQYCLPNLAGRQQMKSLLTGIRRYPLASRPAASVDKKAIIEFQMAVKDEGYAVSYQNRLVEAVRNCINWATHQIPPLMTVTDSLFDPKYGVRISKKAERKRNPRLSTADEQRLRAAALKPEFNTAKRGFCGPLVHDLLLATYERPLRIGELLPVQNRDVNAEEFEFRITVEKGNGETTFRWVPYDSDGSLREIFKRRDSLGPSAYVFGTPEGGRA